MWEELKENEMKWQNWMEGEKRGNGNWGAKTCRDIIVNKSLLAKLLTYSRTCRLYSKEESKRDVSVNTEIEFKFLLLCSVSASHKVIHRKPPEREREREREKVRESSFPRLTHCRYHSYSYSKFLSFISSHTVRLLLNLLLMMVLCTPMRLDGMLNWNALPSHLSTHLLYIPPTSLLEIS